MEDLIQVFRIEELTKKTRARIIIKLGEMINYKYGSNVTEPIVYELVSILEPNNKILSNEDFKRRCKIV